MNKRIIIPFTLVAALTLSLAAVMIGCNAEKNPPEDTSGSLNGSIAQTIGSSDTVTEGTVDIPGTDGTSETPNPTENEADGTKPVEPTASMGVIDGAGSRDPDADEPVVPNKPTNPSAPANDPTEATEPEETTKPVTPPATTPQKDDPLGEDFDIDQLTFEKYEWGMTAEQQKAVIDLFSTPNDFVKWYKAMAAQYKAEHPEVEIGDGGIVDLTP